MKEGSSIYRGQQYSPTRKNLSIMEEIYIFLLEKVKLLMVNILSCDQVIGKTEYDKKIKTNPNSYGPIDASMMFNIHIL